MQQVDTYKYTFITYIKAFAIIAVVITHCSFSSEQRLHIIFPLLINMAVPFFMIITAFNYSNSYKKNNIYCLKQMYNISHLIKRFNRLFIPFIIIALIEYFFIISNYNHKFITFIINGASGPGSYYFPVMVQLLILFPLLFVLISKLKERGVILVLLINFLYEFLFAIFHIDGSIYRLFVFRYLSYIALGIYGFLNKDKIKESTLKFSLLIGLFYIILSTYNSENIFYPFIAWKSTSMLSAFYVFALFMWCYKFFKNFKFKEKFHYTLELIGNASWHIFLIQMVFFVICNNPLFHLNINLEYNLLLDITLKVLLCITTGVIYYYIESYFYNLILNKKHT